MRCSILLVALLFVVSAKGESSEESQSSSTEESDSVSKDSNEASIEVEVIEPSDSTDRFTFTEADAKPRKQQLQDNGVNAVVTSGVNDDAAEVAEELDLIETLLTDSEKFFSEFPEKQAASEDNKENENDSTTKEVENDDTTSSTDTPNFISKPEEIQIRRFGDLNPNLAEQDGSMGFSQPRQDTRSPSLIDPNYIRGNVQSSASESDNTPILTQGGYQRPYQRRGRFNGQLQRIRTGSASQQSATVETPLEGQNIRDQSGQPRITPQVSYTNSYQPPLSFGSGPLLRQPFGYEGAYPNNPMSAAAQNPFFNAPSTDFGFMGPNFPTQFPQDNRILNAPRDQSGISPFQYPPRYMLPNNPDLLFQSPFPFSPVQPASNHPPRPVDAMYMPGSFSNYPGINNVDVTSKPDYSAFFRNPSPFNPELQANPNFYAALPNPASNIFNNPTVNLMPNYPSPSNGSPLSSTYVRYSTPDGQKMLQSTDEQAGKQPDSDTTDDEQKEKDFDQIKESPNKEDPLLVPFGARIQRQEDQNQDFTGQRDVYIRYPMSEAGYATEENLPIQNTTQRSMRNSDIPQRQSFPYFNLPRQFPGYSSPDPYRNALNAVQQGFSTANKSNGGDSNKTRETGEAIVPFPFDQTLPPPQRPVFATYPDRNRDLAVLHGTPFYPGAGLQPLRNPFDPLTQDALAVFSERNYPFSTSIPTGNEEKPDKIPACAQKTNASMCFEDSEYPRREILYALNSDSFLLERLVMPDQKLDGISLVEQNTSENPDSTDNYICKSDIKTGMPLRAKNIEGKWKVIVNTAGNIGKGILKQPIRLEICRGASEPCSYTQKKTECVQKYSLQRLLSWNREKGIHNDVYKLPVACSCQIVEQQ